MGKRHRDSFPKGGAWRAKSVLELVHADVCGTMRTSSQGKHMYFILFIDDHTRMTWVYFIRQKLEVYDVFRKFKSYVEKKVVVI